MPFKKGQKPWNAAKKGVFSPETLAKMRKAKLGKKPSNLEELIKLSKETHSHRLKKLGKIPWNKGKKGVQAYTEEWRKNNSDAHKGLKSYLWKGGITPLTKQIRACFEYRQWKSDCFRRDDYTCQLCGDKGGWKEVDHYPKTFSSIFHDNDIKTIDDAVKCVEFWDINNGRTLCNGCHIYFHHEPKK